VNITTRYSTNPNSGAGRIIATATVDGKKKQQTVAYEQELSKGANHGRAAGMLAHRLIPQDKQTHELRRKASYTLNDDQSYTFTV